MSSIHYIWDFEYCCSHANGVRVSMFARDVDNCGRLRLYRLCQPIFLHSINRIAVNDRSTKWANKKQKKLFLKYENTPHIFFKLVARNTPIMCIVLAVHVSASAYFYRCSQLPMPCFFPLLPCSTYALFHAAASIFFFFLLLLLIIRMHDEMGKKNTKFIQQRRRQPAQHKQSGRLYFNFCPFATNKLIFFLLLLLLFIFYLFANAEAATAAAVRIVHVLVQLHR